MIYCTLQTAFKNGYSIRITLSAYNAALEKGHS